MRYRQTTSLVLLGSLLALMIFSGVASARDDNAETGTVSGVVATAPLDGQSYNIPGAKLKLKQAAQVAETSSNDSGAYEFTKVPAGESHWKSPSKVLSRAARPSLSVPGKQQLRTSEWKLKT